MQVMLVSGLVQQEQMNTMVSGLFTNQTTGEILMPILSLVDVLQIPLDVQILELSTMMRMLLRMMGHVSSSLT